MPNVIPPRMQRGVLARTPGTVPRPSAGLHPSSPGGVGRAAPGDPGATDPDRLDRGRLADRRPPGLGHSQPPRCLGLWPRSGRSTRRPRPAPSGLIGPPPPRAGRVDRLSSPAGGRPSPSASTPGGIIRARPYADSGGTVGMPPPPSSRDGTVGRFGDAHAWGIGQRDGVGRVSIAGDRDRGGPPTFIHPMGRWPRIARWSPLHSGSPRPDPLPENGHVPHRRRRAPQRRGVPRTTPIRPRRPPTMNGRRELFCFIPPPSPSGSPGRLRGRVIPGGGHHPTGDRGGEGRHRAGRRPSRAGAAEQ